MNAPSCQTAGKDVTPPGVQRRARSWTLRRSGQRPDEKLLPSDLPRRMIEVDSYRQYLADLGRYPRLTLHEEAQLIARIANGEHAEEAKRRLILAHLRLVVSIAKRYARISGSLVLMDLIQEGTLGLMHATQTFDADRGWRFSTHATWSIRQAITRAIANQARLIRLPVQAQTQLRAIERLQREADLSAEQLAPRLHLSPARIRELLSGGAEVWSLDVVKDGNSPDLDLTLTVEPLSALPSPEEEAATVDLHEQLNRLLAVLNARERRVIELRYGLGGEREHSREEIALALDLSPEWIRQIERKALQTLRKVAQARSLQDYLRAS